MRARAVVIVAVIVAAIALGTSALAAGGDRAAAEPSSEPARDLGGEDAVRTLGPRLAAVAARYGRSAGELAAMLRTDPTLRVDPDGMLLYADPLPPLDGLRDAGPSDAEPGPFPPEDTFRLHSLPGASRTLFIDVDGHTVAGTAWNDHFGLPARRYPGLDLDGDPATFSSAELDLVQGIWLRVAEDFAPFGIDVTTEEPPAGAIDRSGTADTTFGTRVLLTSSDTAWATICERACGGMAYVGVFDEPNLHSVYQPALVFTPPFGDNEKYLAEVVSHEAGHNLGLAHDGQFPATEYFAGQGAWAPIMGVGYYRPLTQFSPGDYGNANNTEDDLAVIAANGGIPRSDDHGDSSAAATDLGGGDTMAGAGVIATRADVDVFRFTHGCRGPVTVDADPGPRSPNLDIRLELRSSAGATLATADPPAVAGGDDILGGLDASLTRTLDPGTYLVSVDGVGHGSPLGTGYSDAGSLGAYSLTIDACPAAPTTPGVRVVAGTALEGTGGSVRDLTFVVALDRPAPTPTSVVASVTGVDATAGVDTVTRQPVTLRFPAGETVRTVVVKVRPDALDEPDERIAVTLMSPIGLRVTGGVAEGVIVDDDVEPGVVLAVGDAVAVEGSRATAPRRASVPIQLNRARTAPTTVTLTLSSDTADVTTDISGPVTRTVTIPAGRTTVTVPVVVRPDVVTESTERIGVRITAMRNGGTVRVLDGEAVVTILDDDAVG